MDKDRDRSRNVFSLSLTLQNWANYSVFSLLSQGIMLDLDETNQTYEGGCYL